MTNIIHRAIIYEPIPYKVITTKDFSRVWQARKWANKVIDRNKKIDEWYFKTEIHFIES